LNEIKTISNVRHPNLVELIGCCVQGANRILVYEYLENNSLDRALLGEFMRSFIVTAELVFFYHGQTEMCNIFYPFLYFQVQGVQILD
jgi:serine/threonine protein kinase